MLFINQRGSPGVGSILAVAVVALLSIIGTVSLVKVYRDGATPAAQVASGSACHLVCAPTLPAGVARGT